MDDLLYQFADGLSGTPFPIYLRLAEKDPGGEVAFGPEIHVNPQGHFFAATDLRRSRPIDRDGDGTQELFAAVDPFANDPTLYDTGQLLEAGYLIFHYDAAKQAFEAASGDGQSFFPADPTNDVAQLTDIDGNGKLDLFRELTPGTGPTPDPAWFFYPDSGTTFGDRAATGVFSAQASSARALDLDQDGRGELLIVDPDTAPGGNSNGPIPGKTMALGLDDNGQLAKDPR